VKYGHFDEKSSEYVVTRPDTPTPWINYIGEGDFGGIVTNTGGGYSFDKDPRNKRILRYRYNNIPMDRPGRYVYIRDAKSKEYWSPTWQPTLKKLDKYEARVGMGYTSITGTLNQIQSNITYFVPPGERLEVWRLKVKNLSKTKRKLQVFSYAEFCFYDAVMDQHDVDWVQQINQSYFDKKLNSIFTYPFMKVQGYSFFTSNGKVSSYDCDLEKFVGKYRSEANPIAVENGFCSNSVTYRGNSVGGTCNEIELKPGQEVQICFLVGTCQEPKDVEEKIKYYQKNENVDDAFKKLTNYWQNFVSKLQVNTPDQDMNLMLNLWNQYQCKSTFNWSRFVSMYQLGVKRGMGFRDSAQDALGVMHTIPQEAKTLIVKLLKNQFIAGDAYHQFFPLTGEGDQTGYSDDHLWIILSVASYIKETGDTSFLNEQVPYADNKGIGSVLEHLEKAVSFSLNNLGPHGIPKAGFADWNDTYNLDRGKGIAESVWVGMMLAYVLLELIGLLEFIGDNHKVEVYRKHYETLVATINKECWDGKWYVRAWDDDGNVIGSDKNEKCKIDLIAQNWAVMSGVADKKRGELSMDSAHKMLNTKHGIMLIYPSFNKFDPAIGGVTTYPPGAKENGGIFLHTNPWSMVAKTMQGDGDQAFAYYKQIVPASRNETVDAYEVEPYVYCQNILGKEHPQHGLGRNSWLSGTASWNLLASSNYILGIRAGYKGLIVDPCIPKKWKGFTATRVYRNATYHITVKNPKGVSKGIKQIIVDGVEIEGPALPIFSDNNHHDVEIVMGTKTAADKKTVKKELQKIGA